MTGKSRIMIYGPKDDGTYIVEFRRRGRGAGDLDPPDYFRPILCYFFSASNWNPALKLFHDRLKGAGKLPARGENKHRSR